MNMNRGVKGSQIHYRDIASFLVSTLLVFLFSISVSAQSTTFNHGVTATEVCSSLLVNGDFESSGGWVEYSKSGASLISSFPPPSGAYHSGEYGAYLGDYNSAFDYIAQAIRVPTDATRIQLTFWWQVESSESRVAVRDVLTVTLDPPRGNPLVTVYSLDNRDQGAVWKNTQIDLTPYLSRLSGRTIYLRFEARTDINLPTAFYLDDISLNTCRATPTPTPSPAPSVQYHYFMPGIWH